jgi:hypothetical protein
MTDVPVRASRGVRPLLRALFGGAFAVLGLIAGGCGNNTITYGTVVTTVSSDPGPFTAYIVDLYSLYLVLDNGNVGFGFTGSGGVGKAMDFTKLGDRNEVLGALAVPEGTYTSATVTFNYGSSSANTLAAQLYIDINGTSTLASIVDQTGAALASTVTYTIKFDPAHPLVVKKGTPTKLDLHFDMSASSVIDRSAATPKVTVRPFMSASTGTQVPDPGQIGKALRVRGEFVGGDTSSNSFTVNTVSFYDLPSYTTSAQGAVQIQPNAQTTYNINGQLYQGAAGFAAIAALPLNTTVSAFGTFSDTTQQKPVLTATQVYAGIAAVDLAAAHVTGTVRSRSGNTFHVHNAELTLPPSVTGTGFIVELLNDVAVTVNDQTLISVDGQSTQSNAQAISIGQQVEFDGVFDATNLALNASGGVLRLTPTTAWGYLTNATAGSATANLVSLGGVAPAYLALDGTGSSANVDPANYPINTGTLDLSTQLATTPPLFRFDGIVAPFGAAPPAFTASAATPGSSTFQVLTIDWTGSGTTAPFVSVDSTGGLVVNIDNASLGPTHVVQTGPVALDLKAPEVNPTIVADTSGIPGQFSIGNGASSTAVNVFHGFGDFVSHLGSVLNGTNTVLKLVAVGKYDQSTAKFTAYRIDVVQLP